MQFGRIDQARSFLAWGIALFVGLAALYLARFGVWNDSLIRVGSVVVAVVVISLNSMRMGPENGLLSPRNLYFAVMIVIMLVAGFHWQSIAGEIETGLYDLTPYDSCLALAAIAVVLELTRRFVGLPLALICTLAIGYSLFGNHLPWIFRHTGFSLAQTMNVLWYGYDGVFGTAVAVVTSMILVYIVFGAVLEGVGAGDVLLKIAFRLTGRLRGGPAHAAIVSSTFFGTMSGSVAANVVGTGTFTIPMIKSRGFSPRFAGAIEAAASTGGQFTPPVMGAAAFIMADILGIPYLTICVAALIPALLYYYSLFCTVAIEADRLGIEAVEPGTYGELTRADKMMAIAFVVPLVVIVATLIVGRSPAQAGFYATISALVLGILLNANLRRKPKIWLDIIAKAGTASANIMIPVAAVGIIIGIMNQTGLGLRFASILLSQAQGSLFIGLLVMMLGCIVLGMGMPTVPAYLTIVLVIGPAISKLDVPILSVHLFAIYYGVLSAITPPVALAAYVAAPIAGAKSMATALTASRVALAGFIVPFAFVYNPSLLLVEGATPAVFGLSVLSMLIAIWLLATSAAGHDVGKLHPVMRLVRLVLVPFLVLGSPLSQAILLAVGAILLVFTRIQRSGWSVPKKHAHRDARKTGHQNANT